MLLAEFTRSPTFADKTARGVPWQVPRAVRVLAVLFAGWVRGRCLPGMFGDGPGARVAVGRGSRVSSVVDLQGEVRDAVLAGEQRLQVGAHRVAVLPRGGQHGG